MTTPPVEPFDDADPEDGWDASDAVIFLLDNIAIRLHDLFEGPTRLDRAARLVRLFENLEFIRVRVELGDL